MNSDKNNDLDEEKSEDTIDGIINWKKRLEELATQNRFEVKYDDPIILDEDENYPLFKVKCSANINGKEVVGVASRRNKHSAQRIASKKVIEKLERNEETESQELTKFYSDLANNEEVSAYLKTSTDDIEKLDNVLSLIGCLAEYNLSNDQRSVMLKIVVRGERNNTTVVMNFVEMITENSSVDHSKHRLAQKAINVIKMFI